MLDASRWPDAAGAGLKSGGRVTRDMVWQRDGSGVKARRG